MASAITERAFHHTAFGRRDRGRSHIFVSTKDRPDQDRAIADADHATLRTILEFTLDRVVVLDQEGRFLFVNQSACRHLGIHDPDSLIGTPWHELWDTEAAVVVRAAVTKAAAGHATRFTGMMSNFEGFPVWWDVSVTSIPTIDGYPRRILAVSRDVTVGRTAEEKLRLANICLEAIITEDRQALIASAEKLALQHRQNEEMRMALLQAQKLEALGQLTSSVAHDFNNILAAIKGSFELLIKRVHDEAGQRLLRNGTMASDRAVGLVQKLLAFARREQMQPVLVNLADALTSVRELVRQAVGLNVRLVIQAVPANMWKVVAEPNEIEIALLNLAINARDAMPEGGTIMISASNAPGNAKDRQVWEPTGDHVLLVVQDTGTGMSPAVLARATEAFFTTKEAGKGTGLGLAMVHRLAEASGGKLHIESVLGSGTTMTLALPRANEQHVVIPARNVTIDPARHGDATLLVVDDDEQVRTVTASFLRDLRYHVIEATNGDAAVFLAQASGSVDLVVSDVAMPGCDGPMLAARLRTAWPALPIIFVTGFAGNAALADETVIMKPYAFPVLAGLIAERLGR